jgi:hypothetical protein
LTTNTKKPVNGAILQFAKCGKAIQITGRLKGLRGIGGCQSKPYNTFALNKKKEYKMFNVSFCNGSTLQTIKLPMAEIEPFLELVRKYGYQDKEGKNWTYESAQVDGDQEINIFLVEAEAAS